MKKIASWILVLMMLLTLIPVTANADQVDGEDMILDYGSVGGQSVSLMSVSGSELTELADIPEGESYQPMQANQEIIDVIKDFEGFSAKAYWDNSQWSVGYGTRCSSGDVTVTRAEAERLLRKMCTNTPQRDARIKQDARVSRAQQPTVSAAAAGEAGETHNQPAVHMLSSCSG